MGYSTAFITGSAAAAAATTYLFLSGFRTLRQDYDEWYALGRGGIERNVYGWAKQSALRPLGARDTRGVAPFRDDKHRELYGPVGLSTYLDTGVVALPQRGGERPAIPSFVIPQRQATQLGMSAEIRETMDQYLRSIAEKDASSLELYPSKLEGGAGDAVYLREIPGHGSGTIFRSLGGEMFHIHPEGSSHMTLSLVDAEEAVSKGWAERHRFSGIVKLPVTYVLVYAPRDEEELETWKVLIDASRRFALQAATSVL